jgi:hypothetical protein
MKEYLIKEFGKIKGNLLYEKMLSRVQIILKNTKGKSKSQIIILRKTILSQIALYQILCEEKDIDKDPLEVAGKYMCQIVGEELHAKYAKAEKIPFFYSIYSKIFMAYTKKSDAWESEISSKDKTHFSLDIHKCLWHDACVENGCPEICKYFCKCDNITYGGLKTMGFKRTQTLGMGGTMCDFTFYKK